MSLQDYEPIEPVIGSDRADAIYLGRLVKESGIYRKIMYGGDQHVVLIGPNGKGKSVSILFPNLLRLRNRSVVVVDVKGELAAVSGLWRRNVGRVVMLNPFGLHVDLPGYEHLQSHGFNPLAQLDHRAPSFNRMAARMAEALISIDPETKDPHWPLSGRALVAALIMYATIEAAENGEAPTMRRVRELICQASKSKDMLSGEKGLPVLAKKMISMGLDEAWSQKNYAGLRNKAGQFYDYTREVASIASTARIQTEPFDDPEIADDMEGSDFDFRTIKRVPTTVYIILPPEEMERHSKWLRIVLTAAFQGVMRVRRKGEPKTLFILDEFFALGRLDIVATVWALVRGYGVQIMPVVQDISQLKILYSEMWETFLGMAGAVLSFAPNDNVTADWLAKRAGETTRDSTSRSVTRTTSTSTGHSKGGSSGTSSGPRSDTSSSGNSWGDNFNNSEGESDATTTSKIKAPVLTAHKLRGLRPGFMVATFDGVANMQPIYAAPYMHLEAMMQRAQDNPYHGD